MAGPPPYNYLTGRACPQRDTPAISGMWFDNSSRGTITNPSSVAHFPGYSQAGGPPSWAVGSISVTTPQMAFFPAWWTGTITYSATLGFFYEVMGPYKNYYDAAPGAYSGQQYNLANSYGSGGVVLGGNVNYKGLAPQSTGSGGPRVSLSGLVTGSTNTWSGSTVGGFEGNYWLPGEVVTAVINGTSTGTFEPGFHSITTTVDLYTGLYTTGNWVGYFMGGRSGPWPYTTEIDTNEGFDMTVNVGSLSCSAAGTYTETGNLNPPPSLNLCSTP